MKLRVASKFENIRKHFDFIVKLGSKYQKVEVKSMKSRKRGQPQDPTCIFIETQSVKGYPGWVHGEADTVAFEQPEGFLMIPRV